jgi:hypothetical protein
MLLFVLQLGTELVVEEVSEEFTCYDSEKSSANSDKKGLYVHNKRVLIHTIKWLFGF